MRWLAAAALLPGRTLHVALSLWSVASLTGSVTVTLTPAVLQHFGVSREAALDAVARLVAARLVVREREPMRGRHPVLTLLGVDGFPLALPE